jgi:hypothetical protein
MRTIFPLNRTYIWEKLFDGLASVAEREGALNERLANAYSSHLSQLESDDPSDLDVPIGLYSEMQKMLLELRERFVGRTSVEPSRLKNLDNELAEDLVHRLVTLYGKVIRLLPEEHVALASMEEDR